MLILTLLLLLQSLVTGELSKCSASFKAGPTVCAAKCMHVPEPLVGSAPVNQCPLQYEKCFDHAGKSAMDT